MEYEEKKDRIIYTIEGDYLLSYGCDYVNGELDEFVEVYELEEEIPECRRLTPLKMIGKFKMFDYTDTKKYTNSRMAYEISFLYK